MYEHKGQKIIPAHLFVVRIGKVILATTVVVFLTILFGAVGFSRLDDVDLVEGLHHSVKTALGHYEELHEKEPSTAHLLFETFFVLLSRLVFFASAAFVATPIFHRIMHKLHLVEMEDDNGGST